MQRVEDVVEIARRIGLGNSRHVFAFNAVEVNANEGERSMARWK